MPVLSVLPVLLYSILVPALLVLSHPNVHPCSLSQSTARCNSLGFSSVPNFLPPDTKELFMNQNYVLKLQTGCLLKYPSLRLFSCSGSRLRTVEDQAFSSAPLIESLILAHNELHSGHEQLAQSLRALPRLRTLDLSSNGLTEDMASHLLKNLTSLEFLYLSGNVLLRLDESTFEHLHQLKELNLERNMLFEIDGAFDHMTKLQRLNLAFNSLPCLVKFEMTQLVVLNASHNIIEWFITNPDLSETFQLETLDMSDNKLLFFPFLPAHNRIKTLLLANNQISFYSHLANDNSSNWTSSVEYYNVGNNASNVTVEVWDDSLHGNISSVELLDLSGNQLRYFPQGFLQKMPHLYWLRLRSNCLEFLNLTVDDMPATLYELDVSNNRLTELHAQPGSANELNNLTHLNLSLNDIQTLPPRVFTTLPSLSTVDLSYNAVDVCHPKEVSDSDSPVCAVWTDLSSLKQLYIAGCSIQSLPPSVFEGTPLTHLELSNNPGLVIGQDVLSSLTGTLQHLGLSNTGMQELDFSPFRHLTFLNISNNSLRALPKSLKSLNLKLLDLRDNKLSTIQSEDATAFTKRIQAVYVTGEAFNCCQLEWYRTFEESKAILVVDLSEVTCIDLHQRRRKATRFNSVECGGHIIDESIFWYILLFSSICVPLVGISVIYALTFRPRLLPRAIKKRCWRPTSY